MARRGTPIPFAMRDEAKRLLALGHKYRQVARVLGISHHTVKKYEGSLPNSLANGTPSTIHYT
jgi:DNA-binding NarL/FixJ family response regulator